MVLYNGKNTKQVVDFVKSANLPMSYISQGVDDKTLFIETLQGTHIVRKGDTVSCCDRRVIVIS